MAAGDLDAALRASDRIWRHARDDVGVAQFHGRLLALAGYPAAALAVLAPAAEHQTDPDLEALVIEISLASGQVAAARERLDRALRRFCIIAGGPLAALARRWLATEEGPRGWAGLSPTLALCGEVASPGRARLELRSPDGALLAAHNRQGAFAIAVPRLVAPTEVTVTVNGMSLLGSGFAWPPDFGLDGRSTVTKGRVTGWARLGWQPSEPLALQVEDERRTRAFTTTTADSADPSRQSFALDLAASGLLGNRITISAQLPDGSTLPLPDAPLLVAPPPIAAAAPRRRKHRKRHALPRPVDVVVPVYLGHDETLACLDALRATLRTGDAIIVVDDASPDAALAAALAALAHAGSITLLRNATNLGYSGAVNRGIAQYGDRDVVLLNADAVVHGDWLDRLQRAAYATPTIGTVTPLTNRGSVASYPGSGEQECTASAAAALDDIAAEVNAGRTVDLPVGVGFCLYLRRECLDEIGAFDGATFGKGYGEENDFCLRASRRGWRHVLAADVFVRHIGGRSFGKRAAALMERNRRLLNLRHKGYDALVERFIAADPAQKLRRALDEARLVAAKDRYVVLVTLALPGGVERLVRERCRQLRARGLTPLLLRPAPDDATSCEVTTEDGAYGDLRYAGPGALAALRSLLARVTVAEIEIHHFLDLDRRIVEATMALGVAYDVYIHDYVWICPRVGLVDGAGRYCGEPSLTACETCIRTNGARLENLSVKTLRARSARWLADARAVIVPSGDVARRLARYFPGRTMRIEPWEDAPARGTALAPRPGPVRIALIGAIGEHKGFRVLLACARDAAARDLALEFVVIGHSEDDDALAATGKVFVTGRYDEAELPDLLRRERPHLVLFPSATPETWCYTLSEAILAGVPIVAFDLGAIAERLRAAEMGTLLTFADDPKRLNDRLLHTATETWKNAAPTIADTSERRTAPTASYFTPVSTDPSAQEIDHMETEFRPASEVMQQAITGSVEVITMPKGKYRFSVKTATPAAVKSAGNLTLPAVHVGLGPGVSSAKVKFMAPSRDAGGWLFAVGSALDVTVLDGPVALVLTSVRAAGGQALVVEVDRLDGRKAARAGQQGADAPARQPAAAAKNEDKSGLRVEVMTHVRYRGDMSFVDTPWAGRVAPGLWIEAFAVMPLETLSSADIEYKGLTRTGVETPWISGGMACGTRGLGVPLVGFAARLKPKPGGATYDCEYTGVFQSGTSVGPLRNGVPCRSTVADDPLEGLQIRIVERTRADAAALAAQPQAAGATARAERRGPQFSKFREELPTAAAERQKAPIGNPKLRAAAAKAKPANAKRGGTAKAALSHSVTKAKKIGGRRTPAKPARTRKRGSIHRLGRAGAPPAP